MSDKIYIGTPTSGPGMQSIDPWGNIGLVENSINLIQDPRLEFMEYTELLESGKSWYYVLSVGNTIQLQEHWSSTLLPSGVYEEIVSGDCTLIVHNYAESHLHDDWLMGTRKVFEDMIKVDKIPANKIKWISNGIGGQEAFDAFCDRENLWNPGVKHITFIEFLMADKHQWNTLNFPKRRFIYLQKVHRQHRVALAMWMHKHKIDSYMSHHFTEFTDDVVRKTALNFKSLDLSSNDVEDFLSNLPMEVDGVNLDQNNQNHLCPYTPDNLRITYATERSGIHIIGETYFSDPGVFYSEKTYKPIMQRKPFIMLGQHRSLETLREFGFKTFHPYIDESYDKISDTDLRMRAVADEILRLNNLSKPEFYKLTGSLQDICEHNFHVIASFSDKTINLDELL